MSDIEEDIEKIKQLNNLLKFFRTHGWIPDISRELNKNETIEAIDNILLEREQDKKRIKELEEENKLLLNSKVGIDLSYDDYIPRQKVEEILVKAEVMDYYSLPDVIEDLEKVLGVEDK